MMLVLGKQLLNTENAYATAPPPLQALVHDLTTCIATRTRGYAIPHKALLTGAKEAAISV